jgi:hypothetical protein
VRALEIGIETPLGKMCGVNVGCPQGVTNGELSRAAATRVNGPNERSESAPELFCQP